MRAQFIPSGWRNPRTFVWIDPHRELALIVLTDREFEIPVAVQGGSRALSVRVEPYPGWTGSAVSGTAGPAVDVSTASSTAAGGASSMVLPAISVTWAPRFAWNDNTISHNTFRGDDHAIRLYERLGFQPTGIRRGYYTDNREDALIMWRDPQPQAVA